MVLSPDKKAAANAKKTAQAKPNTQIA